jgi:hypothetical protein
MSVINLSLVPVEVTDKSSKYNSSELHEKCKRQTAVGIGPLMPQAMGYKIY